MSFALMQFIWTENVPMLLWKTCPDVLYRITYKGSFRKFNVARKRKLVSIFADDKKETDHSLKIDVAGALGKVSIGFQTPRPPLQLVSFF